MPEKQGHVYGALESMKFNHRRNAYHHYMEHIATKQIAMEDILNNAGAFLGHMALNRILTIYELYKKTTGLAGHIADVGVYKGASSMLFAKLVHIFESESLTLVHGL